MEINLMYVFIATVAQGLILLILLGILLNKTKQMNTSISEKSSKDYNSLLKALNDLSASTNLRIDDVINKQTESLKANTDLQKLIIDNFNETLSNYKKQFIDLTERSANDFESYKQLLVDATQHISTSISHFSDEQSNLRNENKALSKEIKLLLTSNLEVIETSSAKYFTALNQGQKDNSVSTQKQASEIYEHLSNKVGSLSRELDKELKAQSFKTKQERTSAFEQLSSLLQTIRVENLSEITSNIAKQKNLKIDTSDFEKYLGDCKVVQMTDKNTGQITRFNYEKGIKRSSDTLAGDVLKYRMLFDNEGKVSKGVEFNEKGDIAFEYEYDKAGEISKRNEYIYSTTTKTPKKIEKVY